MNVNKSISQALIDNGYKSAADFCRKTGFNGGKLSQLRKNKETATIGSVIELASKFEMKVSEFVALGE